MSRLCTYFLIATMTLMLPLKIWAIDQDFANTISIDRAPEGKITKVYLKKTNSRNFTEESFIDDLVNDIESVQNEIRQPQSLGFVESKLEITAWPAEHRKTAEEALGLLRQYDLKPILTHPEVKKAMSLLSQESNNDIFNFRVLAVPENPKYYDSNEKALKIAMQASGLVKLALGSSFGVTIALFFIKSSFDMILERRAFFQNYLLYHFEKYGPEKFGVSQNEAKRIKSSIFESRIRWWAFWERKLARMDWDKYGHGKHLDNQMSADRRRKAEALELKIWGTPMGFAFHNGENDGNKKVVNLVTPRNAISKRLSYGFDYANPEKLRLERLLYFVLQMGVRLAPVPAVSTVFDFFVESFYVPQRQMEGSLYGFFSDSGSREQAHKIARQSINPFIITEVANKSY